jgi:predicted flap endonuclease-1-like 5' DNA nuclease
MLFLQLNPFSKPVALSEILIILVTAACIGWLIAKLITYRRISILNNHISVKKSELAIFQAQEKKITSTQLPLTATVSKTIHPARMPANFFAPEKTDDFKIIEGIGPKIEELINKEGIHTYEQLSNTNPIRIANLLKNAGPRFQMHNPGSWPQQAKLAHEQKWEELKILKDKLLAGRQY